jgi:hypothetical protein
MVLAGLALLAGVAAGWLAGRRPPLDDLARRVLSVRGAILVAGVVLLAISRWTPGSAGLALMVSGYALLVAFVIPYGRNAHRPGLVLAGLGLLANAIVITADGGMPVSGLAPGVAAAGHHHGLSTRDHLTGLSDDIRLSPLSETVSPGDLLISLGAAVAVFGWLEPRHSLTRRRPA